MTERSEGMPTERPPGSRAGMGSGGASPRGSMEDPSGLGEWRPDPTGRHQLRWWDGGSWGDAVADHGEMDMDPMDEDAPRVSTKTASSSASRDRSLPRAGIIAGAVAAVVAIVVAVFVLIGGGSSDGFGEFTATLDAPTDIEVRSVNAPAKSMIRVTATSDAGFTPVIVAVTDRAYLDKFDEAADLSDLLDQSDLDVVTQNASSQFSEPSDVFQAADAILPRTLPGSDLSKVLRAGDVLYNSAAGTLVFAAPVDGEFRILVSSAGKGTGTVHLKLEHIDVGGGSMKEFFNSASSVR